MMTSQQKDIAQHMREWYEVFRRHGKGDERSVKAFLEAADLIEKLSAQLVNQANEYSTALKITTEQRDAAVDDIELGVCCETCKHDNDDDEGAFCIGCVRVTSRGNWEWRGVHENA